MVEMGIIDRQWQLTDRDPTQPPWEDAPDKEWQARRMEVYAAQIDRMDQGIGRIIDSLEETGQLDNTLIIFLADNGGCAEEIESHWFGNADRNPIIQMRTRDGKLVQIGNEPDHMPGHQDTYQSYGIPWANLSNTPFRLYKHWVHEGGIATPLIAHWPEGVAARGELRHQPAQLPDIMATFLDVTGAEYPAERGGNAIHPLEGYSLMPIMHDDGPNEREALYFEHEGNCALKQGKWKLVKRFPGDWELYDMDADRTEMRDLACAHPEKVTKLAATWQAWAEPRGIEPWDQANPGLRNA
jgi:arylsulfatase